MQLETMSSTIPLKIYHRILSTHQNQILLLLLSFQNQKKGGNHKTADTPAPAPALETAEEQSHTSEPKSHYMNQKN